MQNTRPVNAATSSVASAKPRKAGTESFFLLSSTTKINSDPNATAKTSAPMSPSAREAMNAASEIIATTAAIRLMLLSHQRSNRCTVLCRLSLFQLSSQHSIARQFSEHSAANNANDPQNSREPPRTDHTGSV